MDQYNQTATNEIGMGNGNSRLDEEERFVVPENKIKKVRLFTAVPAEIRRMENVLYENEESEYDYGRKKFIVGSNYGSQNVHGSVYCPFCTKYDYRPGTIYGVNQHIRIMHKKVFGKDFKVGKLFCLSWNNEIFCIFRMCGQWSNELNVDHHRGPCFKEFNVRSVEHIESKN